MSTAQAILLFIRAKSANYTITISDDDVAPLIGTDSITLLNEAFIRADGFAHPAGWAEIMEIPEGTFDVMNNPTPNGKNQWGIFSNQLAVTGKVFATNTAYPAGTYNNLSESNPLSALLKLMHGVLILWSFILIIPCREKWI